MSRLWLSALALSSITACYVGDLCVDIDCPEPGVIIADPPPSPGSPPALALSLSKVAVARGGVVHVEATNHTTQSLRFGPGSPAFDVRVTPTELPSVTRLDVMAREVGDGVLRVRAGASEVTLDVAVREVGTLGLSIDGEAPRARLAVMSDLATATLVLASPTGEPLRDHSLAIDPSSVGFSMDGTQLRFPAAPGEHVLVLTRATGERYPIDVRVVEQLDDIVVDHFDAQLVTGSLCVHGELAGERVDTYAFGFSGSPGLILTPSERGCVGFAAASPGASITVERAGTTRQFGFP